MRERDIYELLKRLRKLLRSLPRDVRFGGVSVLAASTDREVLIATLLNPSLDFDVYRRAMTEGLDNTDTERLKLFNPCEDN